MTKVAYLECPTGLSGDMCLGALIHVGVPLDYLIEQLGKLGIGHEYHLWSESVSRNGQQATKVHVEIQPSPASSGAEQTPAHTHSHPDQVSHTHSHPHPEHHTPTPSSPLQSSPTPLGTPHEHLHGRHLPDIERLIRAAQFPPRVERWSLEIFRQLAIAEGAVHGMDPDQVHFHEVGAADAIVDIVGTCIGLDWLGVESIYCSPLPTGGGTVRAAHGLLPVPTPAVLKLWERRQVPIYSNGIQRELVTPTGAAIATTLADQFGAPPPMILNAVGLGAGSRDLPIPNILRLWIGQLDSPDQRVNWQNQGAIAPHPVPSSVAQPSFPQDSVSVLETQLDDLTPQTIGYVFDRLFEAGALDVFTQPIGMKKSRPGLLLTVICDLEQEAVCETILFRETTTLGIRRSHQSRSILRREFQTIETPYGAVRIKIARGSEQGTILNMQPEYEDCAAIARQYQIPWIEVHRMALHQALQSSTQEI